MVSRSFGPLQLGPDFVSGWRKLPAEIKIEVLKYALINNQDGPLTLKHFSIWGHKLQTIELLHSTKEIAQLAKEVFYNAHEFKIDGSIATRYKIKMPRRPVNQFIRRVHIDICPRVADWNFLLRFSRGKFGFQNLQEVRIFMDGYRASYNTTILQKCVTVMRSTKCTFHVNVLEVILLHPLDINPWVDPIYIPFAEIAPWKQMLKDEVKPLLFSNLTIYNKDTGEAHKGAVEEYQALAQDRNESIRRMHTFARMRLQH